VERPPDKTCARCGRAVAWRKRWARDWDAVRYCGERCRRTRLDATDAALEEHTLALLSKRARGATICPSEAARAVAGENEAMWRPLMERARSAARRLVDRGLVEITQRGRVVDPSEARGPLRVRRRSGA
jgi:hypothetical protein